MKKYCLIFLLLLSACGEPGPKIGRVTQRKYIPAHTEERWVQGQDVCYMYDKYGTCTLSVPSPGHMEHDYYPDEWSLYLVDDRKPDKIAKGWRQVSESTYNNCHDHNWCDVEQGIEFQR